jgi:hypothetical protein
LDHSKAAITLKNVIYTKTTKEKPRTERERELSIKDDEGKGETKENGQESREDET